MIGDGIRKGLRQDEMGMLVDMRRRDNPIPVLVLTAPDAVPGRVNGLDSWADDYVVKPFDADELGGRIRTLLRRCAGRADPVIERGELTVNVSTRQVMFRGQDLALSAREFAMFEASLERPGPGHTRSATSTSSATGAVQCSMPEGSRDLRP